MDRNVVEILLQRPSRRLSSFKSVSDSETATVSENIDPAVESVSGMAVGFVELLDCKTMPVTSIEEPFTTSVNESVKMPELILSAYSTTSGDV
jgi:hypothetical protein